MRHKTYIAVFLLTLICGLAIGQSNNFVGTWSNKKSEFYTVGFGLRQDGRGVFGAAIGGTLLRWTNTADGIEITIAGGEGHSTNMTLRYDTSTDQLLASDGKNSTMVFFRISTNSPPDVEAEYEARLEKEHADRLLRHPPPPVTFIATDQEFWERIQQLAKESNSMARLSITSANKKTFRVSKVNYLTSIMLTTVKAGKFPKVTGAYSTSKPDGEYDTTTLVPEERVSEFRTWLDSQEAKNEVAYYVFRSPWRTEGYQQFCEVNIVSNETLFIMAVKYLIEKTLSPFDFPLEAR